MIAGLLRVCTLFVCFSLLTVSMVYLGPVGSQGFGFACLELGATWLGCISIPSVTDLTQFGRQHCHLQRSAVHVCSSSVISVSRQAPSRKRQAARQTFRFLVVQ